jgi:hypothetical protein
MPTVKELAPTKRSNNLKRDYGLEGDVLGDDTLNDPLETRSDNLSDSLLEPTQDDTPPPQHVEAPLPSRPTATLRSSTWTRTRSGR